MNEKHNDIFGDEYDAILDLADSYLIPMTGFQLQILCDLIDVQIKLIAIDTNAEYDKPTVIQMYLDLKEYLQSSYSIHN
jgi:hypothetical protein